MATSISEPQANPCQTQCESDLYDHLSPSLGKTDGIVAKVVDRVPLSQESIAEDDKRASWRGNIKAGESGDAGALNLQDVLIGGNGKVVSGQSECQIRQRTLLGALDGVLTVPALLGTNFGVTEDD